MLQGQYSSGIRSIVYIMCEWLELTTEPFLCTDFLNSAGHPGLLRAVIHVPPGTHHVKFIVDGLMQCSTSLPTTVDFGNNLVNYIEVSADDLPQETPVPIECTAAPSADVPSEAQVVSKPNEVKASEVEDETNEDAPPKAKVFLPAAKFSSQIPQYLVDLDKPEDTAAYQYAASAIEKLPTPPSLPGFLGKPILNAATPVKDDNSVLTMPNHTVLNHLATSSIKNNVLAVSATTRYKRKVWRKYNGKVPQPTD